MYIKRSACNWKENNRR